MDTRPRNVLRRRRRVRHDGRGLRVRQPVRRRVRHADGGAEHGPLQQRRVVRGVLHHRVRRAQVAVVQAGDLHHRHGHQLLPAKLRARRQQRRVVQPAAAALRHVAARLGDHRRVPRGHRPHQLQEGAVPAERGRQVHHQGAQLLRAGASDQCRRQRRGGAGVDQGVRHGLDGDEPELGRQLAEQRLPQRAEPLVPPQVRRRPRRHGEQRRAVRVVVRRHVHVRGSVLLTRACTKRKRHSAWSSSCVVTTRVLLYCTEFCILRCELSVLLRSLARSGRRGQGSKAAREAGTEEYMTN